MQRRTFRTLLVLFCSVGLLGAACGDDDDDTEAGAGDETEETTETTAAESEETSGTPECDPASLEGDSIPIGVAIATTGNVALLGQEQEIGVKIAEKFFNEKCGVNNRPVKVVIEDTGGDKNGAINAFNALFRAGVVGIVGPTLSTQAFAADPLAEKEGVPVLGPSNTAQGIPQIGNFIARVSAPVSVVAPLAVEEALSRDPELKIVVAAYAQDDVFATSETGTFQETVKAKGLKLASVQKFQTTDTDFTSQVSNTLGAKPDLVIVSGLAADGGNFVKQLRELGYEGQIIGGNGLNTANVFPVCAASCDGMLIAQAYSPEVENEANKEFVAAYTKAQKKAPPQFSGQAFTGVQVFVEALRAVDTAQGLDKLDLKTRRAELNKAVLAGKYETPLGAISFDPEGEIVQEKFYVAEIKMESNGKDGKFTFVR